MEDLLAIIEGAGVLVAFIALVVGIFLDKRQNNLSFYEQYTDRYVHIMEELPEEFFLCKKLTDSKQKSKINHYIRIYIDLCSEQYFLRKKKYVRRTVWKEWNEGISVMFKNQFVRDFWMQNEEYYKNEYGKFFEYINNDILKLNDKKTKN